MPSWEWCWLLFVDGWYCVCACGGPEFDIGCLSSFIFWDRVSNWTWSSLSQVSWLAPSGIWLFPSLSISCDGAAGVCHHMKLFLYVFWDSTPSSSCLHSRHFTDSFQAPNVCIFFNSNRTIDFTILQEMRVLRVWSEPGILSPANLHQASCFDESSMAVQRMSASVICVYLLPHCTTCKWKSSIECREKDAKEGIRKSSVFLNMTLGMQLLVHIELSVKR